MDDYLYSSTGASNPLTWPGCDPLTFTNHNFYLQSPLNGTNPSAFPDHI
jgi:hypothetical protein